MCVYVSVWVYIYIHIHICIFIYVYYLFLYKKKKYLVIYTCMYMYRYRKVTTPSLLWCNHGQQDRTVFTSNKWYYNFGGGGGEGGAATGWLSWCFKNGRTIPFTQEGRRSHDSGHMTLDLKSQERTDREVVVVVMSSSSTNDMFETLNTAEIELILRHFHQIP